MSRAWVLKSIATVGTKAFLQRQRHTHFTLWWGWWGTWCYQELPARVQSMCDSIQLDTDLSLVGSFPYIGRDQISWLVSAEAHLHTWDTQNHTWYVICHQSLSLVVIRLLDMVWYQDYKTKHSLDKSFREVASFWKLLDHHSIEIVNVVVQLYIVA